MIINIRGTSGSGKSTLMRRVMDLYAEREPQGRPLTRTGKVAKQPLGYLLHRDEALVGPSLYVPGHYETACGGCDTINGLDTIFELVRDAHAEGHDVLFEGLIVCSDVNRTVELAKIAPLHVVMLDTPIEVCIESINERRRAAGNETPVNPKNTIAKHKTNLAAFKRFEEQRVSVGWLDRREAFNFIRQQLDV